MLDEVLDNVVDRDVNAHDGDIDEHAAEVWASFMSNIRADGDDAQRAAPLRKGGVRARRLGLPQRHRLVVGAPSRT